MLRLGIVLGREAKVCADGWIDRVLHLWVGPVMDSLDLPSGEVANEHVRELGSFLPVGQENLHLAGRQVFNLVLARACFLDLTFSAVPVSIYRVVNNPPICEPTDSAAWCRRAPTLS